MASELRINLLRFILAFSLTLTLPRAHLYPTLFSLDYSFFSYFQQFYSLLGLDLLVATVSLLWLVPVTPLAGGQQLCWTIPMVWR